MTAEQAQKELEPLAEKLGTTVEHIWDVLKRQAYIDGLSSLLTVVVCAVLAVVAVSAFFYLRRIFKGRVNEVGAPFSVLMEPLGLVILGTILLVLFTIGSSNFYWVISDFFNPEYFAFKALPFSK
jgi:hypothetical protein